jgi:hypothetical protein
MFERDMTQLITQLGITFVVHSTSSSFPDFSCTDAALCIRPKLNSLKGPIKTLNALAAGAIPIVLRGSSDEAVVREGIDALVVETSDFSSVAPAIATLVNDQNLTHYLYVGVRERRVEFTQEAVIQRWMSLLEELASVRRTQTKSPLTRVRYLLVSVLFLVEVRIRRWLQRSTSGTSEIVKRVAHLCRQRRVSE